jgi:hypothetical protein
MENICTKLASTISNTQSQEEILTLQNLLNFFQQEEKKVLRGKKDTVWKEEPMVKAIKKNNLQFFCCLVVLGGRLGQEDFEYIVNKIEDESEKFAGKAYLIKFFLSKIRDECNQTLLHFAAWKGKPKCLKILISCKVNLNEIKLEVGESKYDKIENNVTVNVYNLNRETPLHLAACEGHLECAELLIRKGGDVNAKDKNGFTPLHFAAYYGKIDCLEILLANGADVNARGIRQNTPLHIIGWSSEGSKEEKERCAEMLISAGADVDAKDEDGDTVFAYSFFQTLRVERPDLFTQN